MKTQFTPGPWRVWRDMDPKEPVQIVGMETDFVCQIAGENTNATANARLIASAPDLFAAAQRLLHKLDNITTDEFSRGGERAEREALRAALAKARGEKP